MSPANSGSLTSLRELNRLRVLETVRERGSVSRAEIARQTGLARSTVSSLVSDLHRAGLVVESTNGRDTASSRGGRPPVLLTLNPGAGRGARHPLRPPLRARRGRRRSTIAILAEAGRDLDVDHDAVGLPRRADRARERGCRGRSASTVTACSAPAWPSRARSTARPAASARTTILPGWVGPRRGRRSSRSASACRFTSTTTRTSARWPSPCSAPAAARSEMVYLMLSCGHRRGPRDRRPAPTAATRGTPARSATCWSNESGPICRCGNRGCLETFVGAERRARSSAPLARRADLARARRAGARRRPRLPARDRRRRRASSAARVAALCNQLNPERVVVGGELAEAGDAIARAAMREAVRRYAHPGRDRRARDRRRQLGERAELLGALALVIGQSDRASPGGCGRRWEVSRAREVRTQLRDSHMRSKVSKELGGST